jgi:hypothetical protein
LLLVAWPEVLKIPLRTCRGRRNLPATFHTTRKKRRQDGEGAAGGCRDSRYALRPVPSRQRRKDPTVTNALRSLTLIVALLLPAWGHAQLFRAYLASDGLDTNPCTLPQPCRLLPAALAAVASGGEIWMLDSANYNTATVNITKSVTIQAIPGAIGSVIFTTGSAIFIDTPDIRVTLRNLVIAPLTGGGVDGIWIGTGATGATITVESCQVVRIPNNIAIRVLGNAKLYVLDTVLRDNWYGIFVAKGTVTISRSQIVASRYAGIQVSASDATSNPVVHIDNSIFSGGQYGVLVGAAAGGVARAFMTRSTVSAYTHDGIRVATEGAVTDAFLEISESASNGNAGYGLYNFGGTIRSAGNNRAEGNGAGATSGTISVTGSH